MLEYPEGSNPKVRLECSKLRLRLEMALARTLEIPGQITKASNVPGNCPAQGLLTLKKME
jgi:hypothetical protein